MDSASPIAIEDPGYTDDPGISIYTTFYPTTDTRGRKAIGLKLYIDGTQGFSVDPGKDLFLVFEEKGVNYLESVCVVSDIYNYPTDSSNGPTPHFRQSYIHKMFPTLQEAVKFSRDIQGYFDVLSREWESIQTAAISSTSLPVTNGSIDIDYKYLKSDTVRVDDGSLAEYFLMTVTATSQGVSDSPVFVLGEGNQLDRVATYQDMQDLSVGTSPGDRFSEFTCAVNSQNRYNAITQALTNDLEELIMSLEYLS